MAEFKTHLIFAAATGAVVAWTGLSKGGLNELQAMTVVILGTFGGLLPDLDSDTGKPLAFVFQVLSVIVPASLYPLAKKFGHDLPFLICYFVLFYIFVNYFICSIIKRFTVHRGILHSIPFALLCGELSFLLFDTNGRIFALYASVAVFAGTLCHLILDELCSLKLRFGFIPIAKRSSGTALALYSSDPLATLNVYLALAATSAVTYLKFHGKAW
jgi:membrane-bound metal-dependent hydrolase YbcI (DUF457 family)